jgi:hypothetical protein
METSDQSNQKFAPLAIWRWIARSAIPIKGASDYSAVRSTALHIVTGFLFFLERNFATSPPPSSLDDASNPATATRRCKYLLTLVANRARGRVTTELVSYALLSNRVE